MIPRMPIALSIIGVMLAALCIWLTVRIVSRGERWAKWTAATLPIVLPLLYVFSFGPACWVAASNMENGQAHPIYWLIGASIPSERTVWGDFVLWWGKLGIPAGYAVWGPLEPDGTRHFRLH